MGVTTKGGAASSSAQGAAQPSASGPAEATEQRQASRSSAGASGDRRTSTDDDMHGWEPVDIIPQRPQVPCATCFRKGHKRPANEKCLRCAYPLCDAHALLGECLICALKGEGDAADREKILRGVTTVSFGDGAGYLSGQGRPLL